MVSAEEIGSRGKWWFEQALAAKEQGQTVFVPQMITDFYRFNTQTPMNDWGHFIGSIKAAGWVLTQWTVVKDSHDHPIAYPVFELPPIA